MKPLHRNPKNKNSFFITPARTMFYPVFILAALIALAGVCAPSLASLPPTPEQIEQYRLDGTLDERIDFMKSLGNHRMDEQLAVRTYYKLKNEYDRMMGYPVLEMAPPEGWQGMPTTGTVNILILCIQFADFPANNPKAEIELEVFGAGDPGDYPYESLTNYYERSSYNQLTMQGNVLGWTSFPGNRDTYVTGDNSTDRENMIMSALNYWDGVGHDFSQYDNDGDGKIDYFAVIWTGHNTGWGTFWWAYKTSWWKNPSYTLDGKTLDTYSWNYESSYSEGGSPGDYKPRTLIHETGHALGLPDYYDYEKDIGPDGGVGDFDMMDANHGDHNAFSKYALGWITPTLYVDGSGTSTLRASDSYTDAAIFMPELEADEPFGEYFIVQNRAQNGNDTDILGEGLAIWHVDARLNAAGTDTEYDNSDAEHKLLRLMEADGLEEIESGDYVSYDADDFYDAAHEFSSSTTPTNARYDGTFPGFYLSNISAPGATMTLDYTFDTTPPSDIASVEDSTGADIDTVASLDTLSANWSASADPESGIQKYYYAIGTTAGATDVVDWTGNATSTTVTHTGLSLTDGETYYFSVKPQNGAGIYGNVTSSDGQTVDVFAVVSVTQVSMTQIDVVYTKEVDSSVSAVNTSNYSLDGGIGNPTGAVAQGTDTIRLTTSDMEPCTAYVLTLSGILSNTGGALYAGSSPADVGLTMKTLVSSNISSDTTWTTSGSPYCLTDDVSVWSGNTLTIQAGTVVYFKPDVPDADSGWSDVVDLMISGELQIQGSEASPVVVTSARPVPVAGDYGSILFFSSASSDSTITGMQMSYPQRGLYINGMNPSIIGNDFSHSEYYGVGLIDSNATVWANTFSECGSGGNKCLTVSGASAGYIGTNTFSGNIDRAVGVYAPSYFIANDFDGINSIAFGVSDGGQNALIKENNFRNTYYGIYTWADGSMDATHNYFDNNSYDTRLGCAGTCSIDTAYQLTNRIDTGYAITRTVLKEDATYTTDLPETAPASSTVYIQIEGTDADTSTINSMLSRVYSDSDTNGVPVELIETGADTGIFRGSATFSDTTDPATNEILAVVGDTVTVEAARDGTKLDTVTVTDDITPPLDISYVYDGPGADIDWASSTSMVFANWAGTSDPESDVSAYYVAIGTAAGATDVFNWTGVATQTSTAVGGLSLAQGQTNYVSVKARNGAGLDSNVTTSDGQTVDNTAPADIATINDGTGADIDFSSVTTSLSANWSASSDAQSGVISYWVAIGTSPGGVEKLTWTSTGATDTATTTAGLSFTHGNTYFFQAAARNGALINGNPAESDGVLIDTTAPANITTVNDGSGADIAWSTSSSSISANWAASSDGESGVAAYYYAIGTAPGATDVVDWTGNGAATSVTRAGLSLSDGVKYYIAAKARNGALIESTPVSSNGWTVDTSAPAAVAAVNDGPGADAAWASSTSALEANWSDSSDPHSGIARYLYAIGTSAGATDVVGWSDNGTATSAAHTGLSLTEGDTYYFSVKAENSAGLVSSAVDSDGQTVDASPPADIATVNDGTGADIAWSTASASLSANWSASSDPQSGILSYWYAIGTSAGGTDVAGWTDNGAAVSVTRSGLTLTEGDTYYFSVKAQSGSLAFSSETYSNGQSVDSQPPADVAAVNDGTGADMDYATSSSQLSANWSATTDGGTGVARYLYAVGTTAGATDVVGWTDNASDTSVTHTGLSLTEAQAYYFTVKAEDGIGFQSSAVNTDGQTVDTVFATQSAWSPADGATITVTTPTITFTTSENAYCRWSETDQAYADMSGDCDGDGTTAQSCTTSSLGQGAAAIYLACRDEAGNSDTAGTNTELSYFVDSILPVQSAWSPAGGETVATTTPAITFTTGEDATCLWSLSDQAYGDMNPANTCSASATVSHSCAVSGFVEGAQSVSIACADPAGNEDSTSTNTDLSYTVDISPPAQLTWNPAKGSTLTSTSRDVQITTGEGSVCRWSLTDQAYGDMDTGNACTGGWTTTHVCETESLVEGFEIVYIACADVHGNEDTVATNEQVNYTVDASAPVQSNWNPADGATITTTAPAIAFDTDENATCRWHLLDAAYGSMPSGNRCDGYGTDSHSCATGGLGQGTATVHIACTDGPGNADTDASNTDLSYFIDTTPPAQSAWSPATGTIIASSTQQISFTTDENAACRWSLSDQSYSAIGDGNACAGATSTAHVCSSTGLQEGAEYVHISCSDAFGNEDTAATNDALNYTIDLSPPAQSGWSPADAATITTTMPSVTFTTDENATCRWSLADQAYGDMSSGDNCGGPDTTSHSCSVSGLSEGSNGLHIACIDSRGIADTAGTNHDLSYYVDTAPPVQSAWSPATSTTLITTSPAIAFTTDENATCRWSLTDQAYGDMSSGDNCGGPDTTSHSCAVSGLAEGSNSIFIACADTPGNEDSAGTNTQLAYTVDTNTPAQSAWSPATSTTLITTSPAIAFTTDENATCRWSLTDQAYGDMSSGDNCGGPDTTSHSCAVSGLSEGTASVYISCADTPGNEDTTDTNTQLDYSVDITTPAQSGWSPATGTYIAASTVTVSLSTDETGDCRWSLTDQAYGSMGGDCSGDGSTTHSCDVAGLADGAESIFIACADTPGNEDTAGTNVELTYTVDTSPPSNVATVYDGDTIGVDIDTTGSGTELSANWTASSDAESGIARYWYAIGTTAGATDVLDWTDNGTNTSVTKNGLALADEQDYYFTVKAENGAGLESTPANSDGQTVEIADVTPPADVASVNDGPGADAYYASSTTQLSANWSASSDAESGVAGYWYSIGTTSGASDTLSWTYTGAADTSVTATSLSLSDGATYYFSVKAQNGVGLVSGVTTSNGVTIDATPPSAVTVSDGSGADIDTATSTSQLSAGWTSASDPETGVSAYFYAVGTSPGATDTVAWTDNGANTSVTVSGLSLTEGTTYYFTVKAQNGIGALSAASNSDGAIIDVSPPAQSAWNPADGATIASTSPAVTLTTDENAACRWSAADEAYSDMDSGDSCAGSGTTSHSCSVSGLWEGSNTIYIACADPYGNEDTAASNITLSYTVDTTPPVQSAWNPADGATVITASPSVTLTTGENATCRWALSDLAYESMESGDSCAGAGTQSHTCAVTGLAEGANSLYFACADSYSNSHSATTNTELEYTVDTQPPAQSGWSPAADSYLTTTSPAITFTTDEAAYCRWSLDAQAYADMAGDCSGDETTSQSCPATGLSTGAEIVYITCADLPGNEDTALTASQLGYTVDTTPPSDVATVYDGDIPGSDIDTTDSGTQLSANWTASADAETGVAEYMYAIGTTAGATDVLGWTSAGTNTFVTKTGLALGDAQTYFFTVKAVNAAGLESTPANSDGQQVDIEDSTPPSDVAWVYDGTGADVEFSGSTSQLSANWAASSDGESGVAGYWYSIGTTAGASDTAAWTFFASSSTSTTFTGLSLSDAQTYYISIKAQNGMGLVSTGAGTSNGVTIDATPPSAPGQVSDGAGADEDYTTSESSLSGNWTAAADAQTGVARYLYSIGTTPGAADIVDWTDNETNTSFSETGLTLSDGQAYYISVKAENGVGLESAAANSDGITKDSSPPADVATVNDGAGADTDTTDTASELSANWTAASDAHSGIATYYYAVGMGAAMNNVVDWTDAGATTSATASGLALVNGETYYFYVKAVNNAGLESSPAGSDGVTVDVPDSTPPSNISWVYDGTGADVSYSSATAQLSASWAASSDGESGIARYWYSIGTAAGASDTLAWTGNGTETSFTATGLTLADGQVYYVSVKAENGVGLFSSTAGSDGVLKDSSPPEDVATVNDGAGADIDTTDSTAQLSANWTAASDSHSGIATYYYAIGTDTSMNNIVDWTDAGAATTATVSGLNLSQAETYYFYVKAENNAGLESSPAGSDGVTVSVADPVFALESGWNLMGVSKENVTLDLDEMESDAGTTVEFFVLEIDGSDMSYITGQTSFSGAFGGGYWIYSDTAFEYSSIGGDAFTAAAKELGFESGWNAFSNPYADFVMWSDSGASLDCGGAAALPAVYSYDAATAAYIKHTPGSGAQLVPWKAYWIETSAACTLTINKP